MTYTKPQLLLIGDLCEVVLGIKEHPYYREPPFFWLKGKVCAYDVDD
jgi:hypothetical protein